MNNLDQFVSIWINMKNITLSKISWKFTSIFKPNETTLYCLWKYTCEGKILKHAWWYIGSDRVREINFKIVITFREWRSRNLWGG